MKHSVLSAVTRAATSRSGRIPLTDDHPENNITSPSPDSALRRNSFIGAGTTFTDYNLIPIPLRALNAAIRQLLAEGKLEGVQVIVGIKMNPQGKAHDPAYSNNLKKLMAAIQNGELVTIEGSNELPTNYTLAHIVFPDEIAAWVLANR